eukprot:TRINITY_DN14571_c0_g1_i2.p1 TRINITY_DN14571_c0_g1~~TRINITY_DN14571_c0_g1_i2.p1  ORF type:complete len:682 (+),score=181.94 TRINITY_DN14571_c0_g1_i2:76-2121(+)
MADGEGPGGERAVGDTVEALHEDGEWYTATVKKVREDGTFDVVWEDGGEKRKKVPPDEIRDPASKKSPKKKKAPPPEVDAPPAAEEPPPQEQPAAQPPAAQPPAERSPHAQTDAGAAGPPRHARRRSRPQCAPPAPLPVVRLHDGSEWHWQPPPSKPLHSEPGRVTPLNLSDKLGPFITPPSKAFPAVGTGPKMLPPVSPFSSPRASMSPVRSRGSRGSPRRLPWRSGELVRYGVSSPRRCGRASPAGSEPGSPARAQSNRFPSPRPVTPVRDPVAATVLLRGLEWQRLEEGITAAEVPADWDDLGLPRAPQDPGHLPIRPPPAPERRHTAGSPGRRGARRRRPPPPSAGSIAARAAARSKRFPDMSSVITLSPHSPAAERVLPERLAAERVLVQHGVANPQEEAATATEIAYAFADAIASPIPGAAGDECIAVACQVATTVIWRAVQAAFRVLNGATHSLGRSLQHALRKALPSGEAHERIREAFRLNNVNYFARPGPQTPQEKVNEDLDRELAVLLRQAGSRRAAMPRRVFRPGKKVGSHVLDIFGSSGDLWLGNRKPPPSTMSAEDVSRLVSRLAIDSPRHKRQSKHGPWVHSPVRIPGKRLSETFERLSGSSVHSGPRRKRKVGVPRDPSPRADAAAAAAAPPPAGPRAPPPAAPAAPVPGPPPPADAAPAAAGEAG